MIHRQPYWSHHHACRYEGGGSGNRITARQTCAAFYLVSWRSFVDVDLDGHLDPPGYTYSPYRDLNCAPS